MTSAWPHDAPQSYGQDEQHRVRAHEIALRKACLAKRAEDDMEEAAEVEATRMEQARIKDARN
eukprot:1476363-Heterocapsa_arctica.AAC.1